MKKNLFSKTLLTLLISGVIVFFGCQKNNQSEATPAGKQKVAVYLNDDPSFSFSKVLIDIRYVEVKVDTGSVVNPHHEQDEDGDDDHQSHDSYGQWDTIQVNPGVYDLLTLRNGVDTLLANGYVWHGRITKVRFTLGTNNTVWTDSTHSSPLRICENSPYVYVKLGANTIDTLPGGLVHIRIDFDVNKSIKLKNGSFCLKAELKAYSHNNTGRIEGKVYPKDARPLITVFNSTDTAFATPFNNGEYKLTGLKEGIYSIYYDAVAPYVDTTITNVRVYRGVETKIPTLTFRK
ncbi:MAG: DUF4382 domain-containing protein [Lacibacter sp.]